MADENYWKHSGWVRHKISTLAATLEIKAEAERPMSARAAVLFAAQSAISAFSSVPVPILHENRCAAANLTACAGDAFDVDSQLRPGLAELPEDALLLGGGFIQYGLHRMPVAVLWSSDARQLTCLVSETPFTAFENMMFRPGATASAFEDLWLGEDAAYIVKARRDARLCSHESGIDTMLPFICDWAPTHLRRDGPIAMLSMRQSESSGEALRIGSLIRSIPNERYPHSLTRLKDEMWTRGPAGGELKLVTIFEHTPPPAHSFVRTVDNNTKTPFVASEIADIVATAVVASCSGLPAPADIEVPREITHSPPLLPPPPQLDALFNGGCVISWAELAFLSCECPKLEPVCSLTSALDVRSSCCGAMLGTTDAHLISKKQNAEECPEFVEDQISRVVDHLHQRHVVIVARVSHQNSVASGLPLIHSLTMLRPGHENARITPEAAARFFAMPWAKLFVADETPMVSSLFVARTAAPLAPFELKAPITQLVNSSPSTVANDAPEESSDSVLQASKIVSLLRESLKRDISDAVSQALCNHKPVSSTTVSSVSVAPVAPRVVAAGSAQSSKRSLERLKRLVDLRDCDIKAVREKLQKR